MAGKRLDALVVRDYEKSDGSKGSSWTKIGAAFEGKDGSWSISLDALPVPAINDKGKLECRILLREPKVRDGSGGSGNGAPF